MNTKIQITVDEDSKPCIKISNILPSNSENLDYDVRDLLIKMFIENGGVDTPNLRLYYPPNSEDNSIVYIKNY